MILEVIKKYVHQIVNDNYHRYKSWDRCYEVFQKPNKGEYDNLELGFFLASWGMYRGSTGALQKNVDIHNEAVEIVRDKKYRNLKCNSNNEVTVDSIELILNLKEDLSKHYTSIKFIRKGEEKEVSDTDTLISKIMLGTCGCVPAYDEYFKKGYSLMKMKHQSFNRKSLTELFSFLEKNKNEIKESQDYIQNEIQTYYPKMKIVDMYFWQLGYEKNSLKNKP